ncbi:VapE domain-containing protein [Novosphingobium sp. KN65.2]|uniref:VapE domain-containing protein n=1 Tax=Novosphingobium sp. KN65.2 TaxID=1478134 RepID=UPI0005E2DC8F|nr:VapE domain-containing protein [Novosphingobium sp. KN65.2]CDO36023.1 DNA primase domain protein [Novosphingobium sp. KN65.2]
MTAAQRHDDLTVDTIESALHAIDADTSREKWARIGMALKSELGDKDGFELFDAWSKTASRSYDEKECEATWKSIKAGGGVNIGTLIYEAQQNGWRFDSDRTKLDAAAIERRRAEREAERKAAEAETRKKQGVAAKLANLTWDAAQPAGDAHPYLQGKGVRAHGLGIGEWPLINDNGEVFRRLPDALLIPIADAKNGKVISLQGILLDLDGGIAKRYLKNGRKRGGYHMIGVPPEAGQPLVFCEGYATGATIHELTGWCVIVTFDAPNLPLVAEIMREKFPQAGFIIAADNDAFTTKPDGTPINPGLDYGKRAADATRGFMVAPKFQDLEGEPTDWNDLAQREGDTVARAQLLANPLTSKPDTTGADVAATPPANDNVQYDMLPDLGLNGKPLATIENVAEVCRRLGVVARYNVIAKNQEILIPGESYLIDNRDNDSFARLESECAKFGVSTGNLSGFIGHIAGQNPFNPVANWIKSREWDGKPRLQALCDTITPVDDKRLPDGRNLKDVLIRRWMVSAITAAFSPDGVSAHGILVFQGPQYLGKTMWFKQLVPEHLGVLQDGMMLNPSDRDSVKQAVSFWLVELGELDATFRKADLAALKSFVTRKQDVLRLPYARKESTLARRTVFFGSVNPREFLHDVTGNRRYWTIECENLDLEAQRQLDMQQVWAEVLQLHLDGENHYLAPEEMAALNDHNAEFQAVDPIEERIQTRLAWDLPASAWGWRTSTEILLAVGIDRPSIADATRASNVIRKLNGGQSKRTAARRLLRCPPTHGARNSTGEGQPF